MIAINFIISQSYSVKGRKVVPVISYAKRHGAAGGRGGAAPFSPFPRNYTELSQPHRQSVRCEDNKVLPLSGIDPRSLSRPARSLVTIPTRDISALLIQSLNKRNVFFLRVICQYVKIKKTSSHKIGAERCPGTPVEYIHFHVMFSVSLDILLTWIIRYCRQ
jgi:hypothetical protein